MQYAPTAKFVEEGATGSAYGEDLLENAARRLRVMALLASAITVVNLLVSIITGGVGHRGVLGLRLFAALVIVSSGALVSIWASREKVSVRQMTRVGGAFLASIALAAGIVRHTALAGTSWTGTWSGVAVAIILFPVLIPSGPRAAVTVGLVATAADFTGYLVSLAAGREALGMLGLLDAFSSDLVAIPVAYALSHLVRNLEDKVIEARRMGSYVLEEKLGAGGMGEVWRGRHARLARPAAIKLIKPGVVDLPEEAQRDLLERFEREAQVTATLRSPHTIEVFDFGIGRDGTFYYVMELLDGVDLFEAIRHRGPFTVARTVAILLQVCESLAEAHEAGLVHRDVKPANLFIANVAGRHDFVKVLDFGLVKDRNLPDATSSIAGGVTGTPAFIAPEQARGGALDGRADVYALGCVAFWLLTGDFVFGTLSSLDHLQAHIAKNPRSVDRVAKQPIPGELSDLVMSCLNKEPDQRPADMREVAEMLAEVPISEPWTEDDAERWWAEFRRGSESTDS